MNFKPVSFSGARQACPLPLAITVAQTSVAFRASRELVAECKLTTGALYSLYYDDGPALFALVSDPKNESKQARKWLGNEAKSKGNAQAMTITFPRSDLVARIWKKTRRISGLDLFEKRGPGKIVFHSPAEKIG